MTLRNALGYLAALGSILGVGLYGVAIINLIKEVKNEEFRGK